MADGDESLLDVFVNIRPDPNFQDIIRTSANEAIAEYARIFSTASIPSPRIGPPNVSGGGSGGGGGGSSGGGGGRGGLAQEYRDAARALEDLQRNLRTVSRESSLSGIVQFDDEVKRLQDQLSDLVLNVRRQTQDRDLLGIQASMQYVEPLRQEILRVFQEVSNQRPLKEQFDLEVRRGREGITEGRISNEYEASLTRGSLASADTRRAIALAKFEVKSMEDEVRRLSLAFNGTAESVDNLYNATNKLAEKNQELKMTYQETQEASKSMNTLSNNAYQLGQAFEDFSVGYSLNGFAGGIRGAANNIAFLLNDMSRLESVQKALPAGWAKQLPLIAGIGSALAIVVLPKVIEWLESLNDIEVQFRDIANELRDSFEDTDLAIKFGVDNDSLRKSLESATSVKDILEEIRDINFDAGAKRKQLLEIFSGLNELELFDDDNSPLGKIKEQLNEIDSAVKTELKGLQDFVNLQNSNFFTRGARNLGANVFSLFGAETFETELGKLKEFKVEIFSVQRAIENAVDAGNAGIVNPELLVRAQRQLAQFSEFTKNNINRVDVGGDPEKFAEAIAKAVDAFAERLKQAEEISKGLADAVGEKLSIAIQEAIKKTDELADSQLLLRRAVDGTVGSQSEFLLEVRETSAAYAKLIAEVARAYQEQGRDPSGLVKQLQAQELFASENTVLSKQKDTIEKIREAEEKLESIRDKNNEKQKSRKSQITDVESFVKSLQTNVLSIDPIDKNTKAIDDLNKTISELNFDLAQQQATSENLKTQFSDPSGFADRQRGIAFARPFDTNQALINMFDKTGLGFGVMTAADQARDKAFVVNDIADAVNKGVREAMQGFVAPVVGEQRQTTDAVRKLNVGARAQ